MGIMSYAVLPDSALIAPHTVIFWCSAARHWLASPQIVDRKLCSVS